MPLPGTHPPTLPPPGPCLPQENEPDIWNAIKFGTILENVVFDDESRDVDYDSKYCPAKTKAQSHFFIHCGKMVLAAKYVQPEVQTQAEGAELKAPEYLAAEYCWLPMPAHCLPAFQNRPTHLTLNLSVKLCALPPWPCPVQPHHREHPRLM